MWELFRRTVRVEKVNLFSLFLFALLVLRSQAEGNRVFLSCHFSCQTMRTVSQHGKGELLKKEKIIFCCLYISQELYLRNLVCFQDMPWPGLKSQIILIWKIWEPESVRLCSLRKANNHLCSSVPMAWMAWSLLPHQDSAPADTAAVRPP